MSNVFHIIKLVLAAGMVIGGTVCLFLGNPLALPLFAGSIAWSLLPEA